MITRSLAALLLIISLFGTICAAQGSIPVSVNADFRNDIFRLLELTGSREIAVQVGSAVGNQIIDLIEKQDGEMSEEVRAVAHEEMETFVRDEMDDLFDLFVPLYGKFFSHEEIRALMEFYESPVGR